VAVDVSSRWHEDWQSATMTLVDDPTIRLPGFHLHPMPVVIAEPVPDRTGPLRHTSKEMGSDRQ